MSLLQNIFLGFVALILVVEMIPCFIDFYNLLKNLVFRGSKKEVDKEDSMR